MEKQTLSNHAKSDPPFHFVLVPIALLNVLYTLYHVVREFSLGTVWSFVFAFGFVVAVGRIRAYATKSQDRVIRLEERIRLSQVLPEPLRARIGELTTEQLVGLRFAPDSELAGLAKRALEEKLSRKAIKESIKEWRPDYARI
jgi:hypothetical protein